MKKILILLLSVVFIVSMSFAGISCKAGAVETAAEEVAVEEAAEEVVGEEAAEEEAEEVVAEDEILIVVSWHSDVSNVFGMEVFAGIKQAGEDLKGRGVKVDFIGAAGNDLDQVRANIDGAIAQNPAGIAISIPVPDAIGPKVQEVADLGIPVVVYNSGGDIFKDYGAPLYIGSDGYADGYRMGERLAALGVRNALSGLVVQEAVLFERDRGIRDAIEAAGGKVTTINTHWADGELVEAAYLSAFQKDPTIDAITNGYTGGIDATIAPKVVEDLGLADQVTIIMFDLSVEAADAIKKGTIESVADQQGWLQGYLSVLCLVLWAENGVLPTGDGKINTGGKFIDITNIDEELAKKGW